MKVKVNKIMIGDDNDESEWTESSTMWKELDDNTSTIQNMVIDMKLDMLDYIKFYNLPLLQHFNCSDWIQHISSNQS